MKKYAAIAVLFGIFLSYTVTAEELLAAETYASYYGEAFHGRPTSSGETFDMNAYTAAHKSLPFGTLLEVTNLENGKKVIVRVNDRGPFAGNREIDLSKAAAESLGMLNRGTARVSIKIVSSLDHAALVATYEQKRRLEAAEGKRSGSSLAAPYSRTADGSESPDAADKAAQEDAANAAGAGQNSQDAHKTDASKDSPDAAGGSGNGKHAGNTAGTEKSPAAGENAQQTDKKYAGDMPPVESIPPTPAAKAVKPLYTPVDPNDESITGPLWRIQLGSFVREENALRLVVQLRKIGIEPAYERTEKTVRVVLPGLRPEDVDPVKQALRKIRITDYVIRQERW